MYLQKDEPIPTDSIGKVKSLNPFPARSEGERSSPERSVGNGGAVLQMPTVPNPQVEDKPTRRRFTMEYKLRILREVEVCSPGGIGAILRREGLYSSQIHTWKKQHINGSLSAGKRGRKPLNAPTAVEYAQLERKNKKLAERLRKAEIIIDVQKKLCDVLGLEVPPTQKIKREE
jgi:transposase-like protein